jgi:hypothetical protein
MKLYVIFSDEPNVKVPLNMKVLGEAWEQNRDFYILFSKRNKEYNSIETIIEECAHLFIRVLSGIVKVECSVRKEHLIIKDVIEVFKKHGF